MNYKRYFAIEKKMRLAGMELDRHDIIEDFTEGKKSGLTQLNVHEYRELCDYLQRGFDVAITDRKNQMRRKIIALFHKMNYKLPNGRADMDGIQAWSVKYGKFHKTLNEHDYDELIQLLTQVENVYASYIKTL